MDKSKKNIEKSKKNIEKEKTDLELLREQAEGGKKFLAIFSQAKTSLPEDIRARKLKLRALEQMIRNMEGGEEPENEENPVKNGTKAPEDVKKPADAPKQLPEMKNNTQRKEWLDDYRSWGIWYKDEHIGATFCEYDFENGARLIVEEYEENLRRLGKTEKRYSPYYHLVGGPEPSRKPSGIPRWERHETYTRYPDSEGTLIEFLKELQK